MPPERSRTISIFLAVSLAVFVAITRLIPLEYRVWNMAAVGALALFAGARIGLWQAMLFAFAAMLVSDFVLLWQNDFNQQYLPLASVYAAYAVYALLGWSLLRRTENPLAIGGTALLGSASFFVITNFASWLSPVHGYDRSLGGLLTCYGAALPFARGTLVGDLGYTCVIFGAYAIMIRVFAPARETVTVQS